MNEATVRQAHNQRTRILEMEKELADLKSKLTDKNVELINLKRKHKELGFYYTRLESRHKELLALVEDYINFYNKSWRSPWKLEKKLDRVQAFIKKAKEG